MKNKNKSVKIARARRAAVKSAKQLRQEKKTANFGKTFQTVEQLFPGNNKTRELRAAAEAVAPFLKRGQAHAITMRALAKKLRCSKGAAERRFNTYIEKHLPLTEKLKSCEVSEGERGPKAIGFYL